MTESEKRREELLRRARTIYSDKKIRLLYIQDISRFIRNCMIHKRSMR